MINRYEISPETRTIMSKSPIIFDVNKKYNQIYGTSNPYQKPNGLWYAFGSSWVNWVKSEMPEWEGNYLYSVDMNNVNILRINDVVDFVSFYERYCIRDEETFFKDKGIDWIKVSEEYDGIEIPNYLYQFRIKYSWYYAWDVASGCIWNIKNVQIKQLI